MYCPWKINIFFCLFSKRFNTQEKQDIINLRKEKLLSIEQEKKIKGKVCCACVSTAFKAAIPAQKSKQKNGTAHTTKISLGENSTNTEAAFKLGLLCLSVAPQRSLLVSIFWMCWKLEHGSCNSAVKLPQTNTQPVLTTCSAQTSAGENASPKGKWWSIVTRTSKQVGSSWDFPVGTAPRYLLNIYRFVPPAPGRFFICVIVTAVKRSVSFRRDAPCRQNAKRQPRLLLLSRGAGGTHAGDLLG